jgi:hypothetical protein
MYDFLWGKRFLYKVEQFPDRLVQWSTAGAGVGGLVWVAWWVCGWSKYLPTSTPTYTPTPTPCIHTCIYQRLNDR